MGETILSNQIAETMRKAAGPETEGAHAFEVKQSFPFRVSLGAGKVSLEGWRNAATNEGRNK